MSVRRNQLLQVFAVCRASLPNLLAMSHHPGQRPSDHNHKDKQGGLQIV